MRAQVSFATHEARRRRTLQGRKPEKKKGKKRADHPAESSALARIHNAQSPLQGASVTAADPFNSLPVGTFAGMHDIFTYYFDNYPGAPPLTDADPKQKDKFIRSRNKDQTIVTRRSNTLWNVMASDETCLLVFLAEVARLREVISPCPRWRISHWAIRQKALQSIRENLPSRGSSGKQWHQVSDAFVYAIGALGSSATMFTDKPAALHHLAAVRELVRLKGGIATFDRFARRAVVWCELHVCAAYQLSPTIAPRPAPPPPPPHANTTTWPSSSSFPPAFLPTVAAANARTLAHLDGSPDSFFNVHGSSSPSSPSSSPLAPILHALTLVSISTTAVWQPHFHPSPPARDAAAAVLDHAAHALLVQLAALDGDDDDEGNRSSSRVGEIEDEDDEDGGGGGGRDDDDGSSGSSGSKGNNRLPPLYTAVLLHAAHVYLWAALSDLPAAAWMNVVFIERLRAALLRFRAGAVLADDDDDDDDDEEEEQAEWRRGTSEDVGSRSRGKQRRRRQQQRGSSLLSLSRGGLLWALVVGWFAAERTGAAAKGLAAWFEDGIEELLCGGDGDVERAAGPVADFPGTDAFTRGWHCLLLRERFRAWRCRRWP
ncbi:hypothetical protein SLS58_011031 [Diplodia intermedia]|uniref:Uncharacterized protein n=1 Tax=Diplodia intermedia TaxID=856260 RepID=A0ABR3T208_9PEZI